MSQAKKPPVPLEPKLKTKPTEKPNRYEYLSRRSRLWLAGATDAIGLVRAGKVKNTVRKGQILELSLAYRTRTVGVGAIYKVSELLNVPVVVTGGEIYANYKVTVPRDAIDELFAILKPDLTADKYNEYVRCKYLGDLSKFKIETAGYEYTTGRPKRLYKDVDWQQMDKLLQETIDDASLQKVIGQGIARINELLGQ